MNSKAIDLVGLAVLAIVAGIILSRDPRCQRGCQTLAQHLVEHGLLRLLG